MTDSTLSDDKTLENRPNHNVVTPAPAPPPAKGNEEGICLLPRAVQVLGLAVAFILGLYLGGVVSFL